MRKRLALILWSCVLCVAATAQQPALTVGTATAVTGQTVTGFIEVSAGSDAGANIPVAVIHGPKPGPTLALVAGAHGTEYRSIIALEKVRIEESCPRFGLHNMRHSLATWLFDQGTSPEIVQRMLRWSSTRMLPRYVHPEKKARRAQGEFPKRMNGKRYADGYKKMSLQRGDPHEIWSGRRDLNPRLRPWQGRTLPLSYSRSFNDLKPKARSDAPVSVPVCRTSSRRHSGLPG
jgi:hypothetical protein